MTDENPAGYYHAEGDPPGTVRFWDGVSWTGEPQPLPDDVTPAAPVDSSRFGGVRLRIGAALIDTVILLAVVLGVAVGIDIFVALILVPLGWWFVQVAMIARYGGTPGKLIVGLRVTEADAHTTPPGVGPAFMRTLPQLVGAVPVIGGLLNLVLALVNIVFVADDSERRSVFDRVGGTRVVRKDRLT